MVIAPMFRIYLATKPHLIQTLQSLKGIIEMREQEQIEIWKKYVPDGINHISFQPGYILNEFIDGVILPDGVSYPMLKKYGKTHLKNAYTPSRKSAKGVQLLKELNSVKHLKWTDLLNALHIPYTDFVGQWSAPEIRVLKSGEHILFLDSKLKVDQDYGLVEQTLGWALEKGITFTNE